MVFLVVCKYSVAFPTEMECVQLGNRKQEVVSIELKSALNCFDYWL